MGPLLLVVAILLPATPAFAHDVGGVGATNFHTTLSAVTPAVDGISVAVIENGSRLELRNTTGTDVIVAGYSGEPYARVGPFGAYVNENSPATYLNESRYQSRPVPAGVDPSHPPVWRLVDARPVLRWHDHRIHWMLSTLPPIVATDLRAPHRVSTWTINLLYGSRPLAVTGTLDWQPGPDPWPWLAASLALVVALALVPLVARPHRVLAVATLAGVAAAVLHGVGAMLAAEGSTAQRLGILFGEEALLIWPFAIGGAILLWHRHTRALWVSAVAGVMNTVTLVLGDAPVWWRSSAPTVLPLTLDRLIVAIPVGVGVGLAAALPLLLHRHAPERRPWGPGTVPAEVLHGPQPPIEPATVEAEPEPAPVAIERRRVAAVLAAGALGAIAGSAAGVGLARPGSGAAPPTGTPLTDVGARTIPFHGEHQPGIVTPYRPQAHAWIAGLDLLSDVDRPALASLLRRWSAAAEALMDGRPLGRPDDAVVAGLGPSALTITVGFGPSLFGKAGVADTSRPEALRPLPAFAGERLDPASGDGDLGVVVAADDPVVAAHAARVLRRLAAGVATVRWQHTGFTNARGNGTDSATPRNLMGQVDGTNNPRPTATDFAAKVFADGPSWMDGGSYLVVRRIRMLLDDWDTLSLADQEKVIGRRKDSGAPLSGGTEFTAPNYGARTGDGALAIAEDAHIRRAAPAFNDGAAMLRRGFSYADGDESGLLFLAWQADPRRGFIPVQRRLSDGDAMGRFIRHEASALFAMPRGTTAGGFVGEGLVT